MEIQEYFKEIETSKEYKGYFCKIGDVIATVILGSICGLKNVSQINQWANNKKVSEFLKEKFKIESVPCYYLDAMSSQNHKTGIFEQMLHQMGKRNG